MKDANIRTAKPGATLWDDEVKGLHVRCFEQRKSFYLYFRTKVGTERKPKLGDYGVLSLAKAREIARSYLAIVAEGKDPIIEREKAKQAPTMDDVWARYEKDHLAKKKASSAKGDRWTWTSRVQPKLGHLKAAEVTYTHIADLHAAMSKATPIQANRALALISKMLNLCEKWELRPLNSNPCKRVDRNKETKRKRYMAGEEAARIAEILAREEAEHPDSVAFLYLLILTGARKGEIANARREWLEGNALRLPDSKTGERTVYLPPQAMAVIDRRPKGRKTLCGIADPKKFWEKVRVEAGCPDLRMHDLRHSFASAALKAGLSLAQIGELLGHASTQTTKRYAHLMEEVAHASVTATADVLERMMKPVASKLQSAPVSAP